MTQHDRDASRPFLFIHLAESTPSFCHGSKQGEIIAGDHVSDSGFRPGARRSDCVNVAFDSNGLEGVHVSHRLIGRVWKPFP